jgi:hypothetical protein
VNATELALRKELAVTRLRVARAELALARAERRPDALATATTAVDLASSVLAQASRGTAGRAPWTRYARVVLHVLHVVLGLGRVAV